MRVLFFAALLAVPAAAQTSPAVRGVATLGATVQSYTLADEPALRQVSVPLSVGVRHASGAGLGLRAVYMTAESEVLAPLSGLSDVQLTASMRRRFGPAAVEASLGASVPAGGGALAPDAFATASALALDDFGFDVTSLGNGSAFAPALTVAVAAGPSTAVGVGVSYVARGAYEPFEGEAARYAPADELALSAGLDARLGGASSVALDVTTVGYGEDEYDGRTYRPGRRIATTMRVVAGGRLIRWHLLARYRHVFDGEAPAGDGSSATRPVPEVRPQHARLVTGLDVGPDAGGVDLTIGARYYGTIEVPEDGLELLDALGEQQVIVDAGVSPRVRITPTAVLRATFVYSRGVLSGIDGVEAPALRGFRAGGGVSVAF